jgi:hypothetical protein
MAADDGDAVALAAALGPVLVGTSPTRVTTFATADCVLRVIAGDGAPDSAGALVLALPVVARLRTGLALGEAVEATACGRGSPADGAARGLAAATRRVAVLVGESSPDVLAVAVAAGASAARDTAGKLGTLAVCRVSVGVAVGAAVAAGLGWPSRRAIRAAGCSRTDDCCSVAARFERSAAVTSAAVRRVKLARGVTSAAEALDAAATLLTAAAAVATSGRVVCRGWRLGVGLGAAAMAG